MKIPFMDLDAQFNAVADEISASVAEIFKKKSFIQGPYLEQFNQEFLKIHGGKFGVGCSNGTSAITVALRALGVGSGDEVLVPNHTFFGTVEPIVEVGAKPVLVDIEPEYRQLDLAQLEKKITPKTRAIIPVHLYGFPEPMDKIMAIARKHNLKVVEDCAQSHLAKWQGQPVGTFGDIATFSFYPGKNLGAAGDAGFILTQNEKLFEFVKKYIDHGRKEKYLHETFGGNFRMDGLQAAVLLAKTKHIAQWTERRRELARSFDERLVPEGFRVMKARPEATPVYHLYVVEVSNREAVMKHFASKNIGCGVHYPVPLNCQPAFAELGYMATQFPVSEKMAGRIMSLPFYPEMSMEQMDYVINEFLSVAHA